MLYHLLIGSDDMFNKKLVIVFILLGVIFSYDSVSARRGCCSWHGGVSGSCRNGKIVCNDGTTSPSCVCEGGSSSNSYSNIVYGCTDSNSINYNPNANRNDGSCVARVYGCMDSNAFNYNSSAITDDGSCIAKIFGCLDKKANNYNKNVNTDDGSCLYTKYKTKYEKIKYKTKYKYKFFGKKGKIIQKGKKGKKAIKIQYIVDKDGNVIKQKVVKKEVVKKPVVKIILTKDKSKNNKYK